jgi:hypothetical protein
VYTKRSSLVACRTNNATLAIAVSNRYRFSGERWIVTDLYGRKECVKVNMEDASMREAARDDPPRFSRLTRRC